MGTLRAWFIEEIQEGGEIGHRQTICHFDSETGAWIMPENRLGPAGEAEWNRIMTAASDVGGEDVRYVIHPVGLMDWCLDVEKSRPHRKRGTGDTRT